MGSHSAGLPAQRQAGFTTKARKTTEESIEKHKDTKTRRIESRVALREGEASRSEAISMRESSAMQDCYVGG